jgi:hypothetical protein
VGVRRRGPQCRWPQERGPRAQSLPLTPHCPKHSPRPHLPAEEPGHLPAKRLCSQIHSCMIRGQSIATGAEPTWYTEDEPPQPCLYLVTGSSAYWRTERVTEGRNFQGPPALVVRDQREKATQHHEDRTRVRELPRGATKSRTEGGHWVSPCPLLSMLWQGVAEMQWLGTPV